MQSNYIFILSKKKTNDLDVEGILVFLYDPLVIKFTRDISAFLIFISTIK